MPVFLFNVLRGLFECNSEVNEQTLQESLINSEVICFKHKLML